MEILAYKPFSTNIINREFLFNNFPTKWIFLFQYLVKPAIDRQAKCFLLIVSFVPSKNHIIYVLNLNSYQYNINNIVEYDCNHITQIIRSLHNCSDYMAKPRLYICPRGHFSHNNVVVVYVCLGFVMWLLFSYQQPPTEQ